MNDEPARDGRPRTTPGASRDGSAARDASRGRDPVEARPKRGFPGWAVLLLGTVAAAAMLPQFAFFVPIVAAAWILARLGFMPRFLGHRHPGVRIAPGPDAPLTTFRALLEAESAKGPDERALLDKLIARADAVAGPRAQCREERCLAWRPGQPRPDGEGAQLRIDDWPELRASLARGDGLALATRSSGEGRGVRRIEVMAAGDRVVLESLALAYVDELRRDGVEIVTTGWLRHAERVRAARASRVRT